MTTFVNKKNLPNHLKAIKKLYGVLQRRGNRERAQSQILTLCKYLKQSVKGHQDLNKIL